jgi:DNA/RNA-binding domain of Phe-tRNA-synthetase-like protein
MAELEPRSGFVEDNLAEEFPELGIEYVVVDAGSGRSPPEIKQRLRDLSDRMTGSKAVHMRQDPIPWAYRVFFRQVGIDPDSDRTPVERIALDRMLWGGLRSSNLLDDALIIAISETGVPVIALDADRVGESLGLRLARDGEHLGGLEARPLSVRQIVVADGERAVAILFGDISPEHGVTPKTKRTALVALQVKGVPRISVEEALWTVAEILVQAD